MSVIDISSHIYIDTSLLAISSQVYIDMSRIDIPSYTVSRSIPMPALISGAIYSYMPMIDIYIHIYIHIYICISKAGPSLHLRVQKEVEAEELEAAARMS